MNYDRKCMRAFWEAWYLRTSIRAVMEKIYKSTERGSKNDVFGGYYMNESIFQYLQKKPHI